MLVSLKWLKELVNINKSPFDFGEALTMSGTKVETLTVVSEKIEKIFSGKIKKIEKHPNANKLVICTIDLKTEERIIITGATNVFEGAIVPVAIAGAVIADGSRLGVTDFRGVSSYGMLCSVEELGMNTDLFSKEILDGIYILPSDTPIGVDLKTFLWLDDVIIDVELTANRGDCQSMLGIARESAAALNLALNEFEAAPEKKEGDEISNYLKIHLENDLCSRYVAKLFRVKKIEPSPLWMQLKLMNLGVRPINNIVDVTNLVMLELGQPLHAFDYESLNSKEIVVKTSSEKTMVTLDGKQRAIDDSMLMITNGHLPVAIAGIMGGENSEITKKTTLVVLESACFNKNSVRLSSKKLGLRTEASARYEKGVDPELAKKAALRASTLFEKIGACEVLDGLIDVYPNPVKNTQLSLDVSWVNRFIGINLSDQAMADLLTRLFFKVSIEASDKLSVTVPCFRQDIKIKEDLAEEVARIYGYDRIPKTIMAGESMIGGRTPVQVYETQIKNTLVGQGYYETLSSSFTSEKKILDMTLKLSDTLVAVMNPLGEENSLMRASLIPHQLDVISLNHHRKNPSGSFFEISNTYHKNPQEAALPIQEKRLVLSHYGQGDYFELKGLVELLLKESGIDYPLFVSGGSDYYHPGRKAEVYTHNGEIKLGELGEIHPMVVKNYSLPKRTYVCELFFDTLYQHSHLDKKFTELPRFPASNRDLAIVLKDSIPAAKVEAILRRHSGELLENLTLFDVYTGKQIPDGFKSLAYALDFRHCDKTLTDDDINPVIDAILLNLKLDLDAQLRE